MEKVINDNIILIGTAHVSKKSVAEVENAITKYHPDIVAVELDEKRYEAITKKHRWEDTSILDVIKSGKSFLLLAQTFLAMIQRKLGKEFGVEPGAEMVAAIKTAKKHKISVALVDRDITVTFKRAWRQMTIREKLRLFWFAVKALVGYDRIEEELEEELEREIAKQEQEQGRKKEKLATLESGDPVKDGEKTTDKEQTSKEAALDRLMQEDVISAMMEELRQVVPNATNALIDERDQYISKKIHGYMEGTEKKFIKFNKKDSKDKDKETKPQESAPQKLEETTTSAKTAPIEEGTTEIQEIKPGIKKRVLAVVGAGHLNGIKKNLLKPQKLPKLKILEEVPKKRISIMKTIGYLIPILFGVLFVYLIIFAKWEVLLQVLFVWFIVNGICSAIGAIIALAHPLTILAAFLAAPFTSLNPTIGAGWVAGYVEVKVRAPTVKDIRKLSTVETMRDFFGNRVIRVLMVMALANLGSMVGTFLAGYYIGDIVLF
jgi:pheromone shutdown protein TraB